MTNSYIKRMRYIMLLCMYCLIQPLFLTPLFAKSSTLIQQESQKTVVSGVISDNNGEELPGVNVIEKGTTNGTASGLDGSYSITVAEDAVLIFEMFGFVIQEITVNNRNQINVQLVTDLQQLGEVVVVGYGSKNKSTFTGSAVTLNADDLNKSSLSVANLLQGRAAGVQVSQNNGTPGASLSIRIRGTNSLNADSEPLYVIDGFPTNAGVGFNLNPEDIASMTILKDAASTAIYGARGANGVILITTKNGINKESKLNIHSSYGFQNIIGRFDLVGPLEHAMRLNELSGLTGSLAPYGPGSLDSLETGLLGTDWQDEVFRTAAVEKHMVSFIGGTSKTAVFSSFDYFNQEGVIVKSKYQRVGARINVDHSVSDKFKMTGRAFGNYGVQNDLPLAPSTINGFLKQVLKANPASSFDSGVVPQLDAQNPLHFLEAVDRKNVSYRTNGYFSLSYEIIKNLKIQSDFGADLTSGKISYFAPSTVPVAIGSNGEATVANYTEQDLIFNPTLNYEFKRDDHNATFLLGYNAQRYTYEEEGITATDFSSDDLGYDNLGTAQNFSAYSGKDRITRKGWFGRVDYDYKNKYIFTGTYRIDGSSVFGNNHKLGYFPSAAIAWRFNEEDLIRDLGVFSTGKARVSYGITGNDRIGSGISLATYASNNSTKYTFDGTTTVSGIAVTRLSNPDLKWEETSAWDLGLELGFFRNRLILEFDYYNKQTNDLLLDRSIAPSTGFGTRFGNTGKVENKGIELSVQTQNINTEKFKWNSTISFSNNKSNVISLGSTDSDIFVGAFKPDGGANFESPFVIRPGEPLGAIFGYVYDGIIQENDPVLSTTHPNSQAGDPKFVDINDDGIIDADDRKVLGVGIPKAFYGFTNNLTYGNFNLDVVIQGQSGGNLLNVQKIDLLNPVTTGNVLNQVLTDTWSPTTPEGTIAERGFYGNPHGGWVNSRFVESSNFLRLKNISLTYSIPVSQLKTIGISNLELYINAQNLYTWTKYSGVDPEIGNLVNNSQQNKNVARGIDFNSYPMSKMYTIGTRITF